MLSVKNLTRRFGDIVAVDDISFDVVPGRLTGFVGGNGAGKTTTMRIIVGVLAASDGEVLWDGAPLREDLRRSFGYMPEERGLYPKMRVVDQLVFFAQLHGGSAADGRRRAHELLERFGLEDRSSHVLQTLSLGNQQRVQIAAALIHRPPALILDEPFSGLDPMAVDSMAGLLGEIAAHGAPDEMRRRGPSRYRVVLADDAEAGWLRQERGLVVTDVAGATALFEVDDADAPALLRRISDRAPVQEFSRVVPRLSEVYAEVVA